MPYFSWKDSYSVGIAEFDRQHKTIFDIVNEIYEAISDGTGRTIILDELKKLFDYADTHFKSEEEILFKYGFPEFKAHKDAHQQFIVEIIKLTEDSSRNNLATLIKIIDFLKDWIIDHILGMDKGYTEFLNSKGIN